MAPPRLIVGISGSSGPIYGVRLLEVLHQYCGEIESHLILTGGARTTIEYELGREPGEVEQLASVVHEEGNVGASIASGSFLTDGMVVAPCSIKTLSAIATSYNDSLISRAADVCLKERRKLVLLVRETPLHLGHLRLMAQATEAGAVILPPTPAFYHRPQSIADIVDQTIVKVLDQFGLYVDDLMERWRGL
ncbi:MAG: UbiX family flavin prenyltransferase [Gaiellales bacterium]